MTERQTTDEGRLRPIEHIKKNRLTGRNGQSAGCLATDCSSSRTLPTTYVLLASFVRLLGFYNVKATYYVVATYLASVVVCTTAVPDVTTTVTPRSRHPAAESWVRSHSTGWMDNAPTHLHSHPPTPTRASRLTHTRVHFRSHPDDVSRFMEFLPKNDQTICRCS